MLTFFCVNWIPWSGRASFLVCTVKTHEIRVKMGQEGTQLRSCLKQMGDIPTTDTQYFHGSRDSMCKTYKTCPSEWF